MTQIWPRCNLKDDDAFLEAGHLLEFQIIKVEFGCFFLFNKKMRYKEYIEERKGGGLSCVTIIVF